MVSVRDEIKLKILKMIPVHSKIMYNTLLAEDHSRRSVQNAVGDLIEDQLARKKGSLEDMRSYTLVNP